MGVGQQKLRSVRQSGIDGLAAGGLQVFRAAGRWRNTVGEESVTVVGQESGVQHSVELDCISQPVG
jgi:hypothetical protein